LAAKPPQEDEVSGVVVHSITAYASTDLSRGNGDTINHNNEAYLKHLEKEGKLAECSSPGDLYEMDTNPSYVVSGNTHMPHNTNTAGIDPVDSVSPAFGYSNDAPVDAEENLYEEFHDYYT